MGIKGLNPFLKKICPDVFKSVPIREFRGRKVAFDAYHFMFKVINVANSRIVRRGNGSSEPDRTEVLNDWIQISLELIYNWINNGVNLIFVFDGDHPKEKSETQKERILKRQEMREKYEKLRAEIEENPLLATPEQLKQLKTYLSQTGPNGNEKDYFKSIIESFGIPTLRANGEGEKLCAQLARDGIVEAVFTSDTDTLAFGAPLLINDTLGWKDYEGERVFCVQTVKLEEICNELELEFSQFVDLCIMAGCDYNDNIPRIAIGKSYKLLKQYEKIEDIPDSVGDKTVLKYEVCRNLFTSDEQIIENIETEYHPPDSMDEDSIDIDPGLKVKLLKALKMASTSLPRLKVKIEVDDGSENDEGGAAGNDEGSGDEINEDRGEAGGDGVADDRGGDEVDADGGREADI